MKRVNRSLVCAITPILLFVFSQPLLAISQWSRKYKVSCTTCHTVFPRLNWYGEQFKWNGYQDPDKDEPDGDETGKTRLNDRVVLDQVGKPSDFRDSRARQWAVRMHLASCRWLQKEQAHLTFCALLGYKSAPVLRNSAEWSP